MTVRGSRGVEVPDYQCMNRCIQEGGSRCQTIPGGAVDEAVGTLLRIPSPRWRSRSP